MSRTSLSPTRRAFRRRGPLAFIAGTPLLVFALAGCGSPQAEPAVATAGGTVAASAAVDQVDWTAYDTYMRGFVKCLNDRGLPDVRYLGHDRPQHEELSGMPPEGESVNPVVTQCGDLWPPVARPVLDALDKPTEEDLRVGRAIAACMRKNGLPDYPDPNPDPAADQDESGALSAELKTNPKFAAAQRRCAKELDSQSTGPVG